MDKEIKYAFVTGASGEIGQAICMSLARAGWNLYLHYYQNKETVEKLLPLLQAEEVDVILIQADFDDLASLTEIEKQVFQLDAFIHATSTPIIVYSRILQIQILLNYGTCICLCQ